MRPTTLSLPRPNRLLRGKQPSAVERVTPGCGIPPCWATVTDIPFAAGETKIIAPANPLRTRVGFASRGANAQAVHNFPLSGLTGGVNLPVDGILWIKPGDGGQLINFEWWGFVGLAMGSIITVYQLFDWSPMQLGEY